jgi:hypothetical protein
MARKKRERQKVIRGGVPSDAHTKTRSILASKLSERSFGARDRALHALWDIRRGSSFAQAARDNGVTRRTIKKYVGAALVQDRRGGRLRATKTDRLVRYVQIPGPLGPVEIKVRGSKQATDAAKYSAAVSRFLRGDLYALASWHGKRIGGVELITSGPALKGLAQEEFLPHSLYRALSGGAA